MRLNKTARGTGEIDGLFRSKLTQNVNPAGGAEGDENDLNSRLFESMHARIRRLEEEIERREKLRFEQKPVNIAPWLGTLAAEQDQDPPPRDMKKVIASYEKTSHYGE